MLGVKLGGGAPAKAGAIVVRQRGTRVHPGPGVGMVRNLFLLLFFLLLPRREKKGRAWKARKNKNPTKKKTKKKNIEQGRDHTLFALVPGRVSFEWDHRAKRRSVRIVSEE